MTAPLLEVSDLRTFFEGDAGPARAVDGVSFRIGSGETVGLVGESGCGKTLTALSLLGLQPRGARVRPGSSVRWKGRELVGAPARVLRGVRGNEISMIFQEPGSALNPVVRVGDQVVEAIRAHRDLAGAEARRLAERLLGEVGLPDPAARLRSHPHELSGGMRQRVLLAMAVACEPALLVADEPTTALDVTIQAQILNLLDGLRARRGMALLLVTHDLGVVADVCERVLVMYAGQIVEQGPVDEVFRRPLHPYTRGLLDAVPSIGGGGGRLTPIRGAVPDPSAWPVGCRFRPRCSHRLEGPCQQEQALAPWRGAPAAASGAGGVDGPGDARARRSVRCVRAEALDLSGRAP